MLLQLRRTHLFVVQREVGDHQKIIFEGKQNPLPDLLIELHIQEVPYVGNLALNFPHA